MHFARKQRRAFKKLCAVVRAGGSPAWSVLRHRCAERVSTFSSNGTGAEDNTGHQSTLDERHWSEASITFGQVVRVKQCGSRAGRFRFETAAGGREGNGPGVQVRQCPTEEAIDRSHGKTMERDVRLNWEVIVRQARERRKERGLTQQHLAALANVGRSTLNRFENQKGDVTLSSVLRILGVLDMLDRKQEGTLRVKTSETESGAFDVTFTPNFGGDPRAAKTFASREALEKFLSDLDLPEE